tara:strand:- start:1237 stop:1584 length:348 start_codon:yes stop_codon:yes gene_type:complete
MKSIISIIIICLTLVFNVQNSLADNEENFEMFMSQWNEKKELASNYLLKAEEQFKAGDELSACATQKEASEYGIDATKALIYAMEINGTTDSLENLQAGLNKWKEIGEVCGSIFN